MIFSTKVLLGNVHKRVVWVLVMSGMLGGCFSQCLRQPDVSKEQLQSTRTVHFTPTHVKQYASAGDTTPLAHKVIERYAPALAGQMDYDPCLGRAAVAFSHHAALYVAHDLHAPRELQANVLHRAGCTDGWAMVRLYSTSADHDEELMEHLNALKLAEQGMTHFGIGRAEGYSPYRWTWAIFSTQRRVSLDPVPRQIALDTDWTLTGRVSRTIRDPEVLLMRPGGDVEEATELEEDDEGQFEVSIEGSADKGAHWVEILGEGELGPEVLALFPVYVGVAPPESVTLEPAPDESFVRKPADAEQMMFQLLNDERERHGLEALIWNDALSEIARGHSKDMVETDFFAHISPTHGDLKRRFETNGYPASVMWENISLSNSVAEAHEGLMESLGHRANILNASATHVGIGVVFQTGADGRRVYHITENFAVPQRVLSVDEVRRELLARLQKERRSIGVQPLLPNVHLSAVAARMVQKTDPELGGMSIQKLTPLVRRALLQDGRQYGSISLQSHTISDPEHWAVPKTVSNRDLVLVGVGVYAEREAGLVRWRTLVILASL